MPEGPEIRIAADHLDRAVRTSVATEVFFAFPHLKPYESQLRGCRIAAVETRGKALLIRFDNELSIYSHNQLYGRWVIRKAYDYPATNRQLRLAIHNARRSALLYSASDIEVLDRGQLASHPFLSTLGPDVLSNGSERVLDQLRSKKHRRRRFSSLLLDQRFVAGIGNYLRSEILFVAGLHPWLRPMDCSTDELRVLADVAVAVAWQSYRHDGVTNDLEGSRILKAQGHTRNQYRHWVFGRGHQPCRRCGTSIVEDTAASRRIFFCPECQPGHG